MALCHISPPLHMSPSMSVIRSQDETSHHQHHRHSASNQPRRPVSCGPDLEIGSSKANHHNAVRWEKLKGKAHAIRHKLGNADFEFEYDQLDTCSKEIVNIFMDSLSRGVPAASSSAVAGSGAAGRSSGGAGQSREEGGEMVIEEEEEAFGALSPPPRAHNPVVLDARFNSFTLSTPHHSNDTLGIFDLSPPLEEEEEESGPPKKRWSRDDTADMAQWPRLSRE